LSKGNAINTTGDQKAPAPLQIGIAGYTFLNFNVDQSIAMMQRVGVKYVSLKDFHLPFDSTQEKMNEVLGKFRDAGITVYGLGVIYMKTNAEVDRSFAYAKKANVDLIAGAPNYELLPYAEQKVKEYNIKLAIHNHGPEDKLYPGPKDVYDRIKNMDPRVGLCLDIGHATRAGADPAKAVLEYSSRIFDLHIKDLVENTPTSKVIEIGRGVINFQSLMKALYKIKYTGKCSVEFEKDMKDPLPGIAESVGFFKGVNNAL
jgi:inosose dehydratase